MKKTLFFATFLLLASCSMVQENVSLKKSQNEQGSAILSRVLEYEDTLTCDFDIRNYVSSNDSIFGQNPLIFDNYDELYSILDSLSNSSYPILRQWMSSNGFLNSYLESIITYDSVYLHIAADYSLMENEDGVLVDFDGNLPSESTLDAIDERFIDIMKSNYSSLIKVEMIHEDSCYLPLLSMSEYALCNDNSLFVVEGMVFRCYADSFLICPVSFYSNISSCNSLAEARQYVYNEVPEEILNKIYFYTGDNKYIRFSENNEKYYIVISGTVYEQPTIWGTSICTATMNVKNLRRNRRGEWIKHSCWTKASVRLITEDERGNSHTFNIPMVDCWRLIGNRTFYQCRPYSTPSSPVDIVLDNIYAETHHGAIIQY